MLLDIIGGIEVGTDAESSKASAAEKRLQARFEQAVADYQAGRYEQAGEGFLEAAQSALGDEGTYTRKALADNRCASYGNAARAWAMAGTLASHRAGVELAAGRDEPQCRDAVKRLLTQLLSGG